MDLEKIKKEVEGIINSTSFICEGVTLEHSPEKKELWVCISTPEARFLIGRNGESLRALSHIIKRVLQKKFFPSSEEGELMNIIVDVNDYQKKRIKALQDKAKMMAERARFFKSNIEVEPMSSFDRRIIHEFLSEAPDVVTESTGEGRDRRVVIKYQPTNN